VEPSDPKVKTHTATTTATTMAIVAVDPGWPNHRSDFGSASTIKGHSATAPR
jgi:hypothetical protein